MGRVRVLASLALVLGVALIVPETAAAALDRPAYVPGDRWVYTLEASLNTLPGLNDSRIGAFSLRAAGRVEMQVQGAADRAVRGSVIRGVDVSTSASGFLNGTFSIPGFPGPPASVTGTFTSGMTEFWEDRGYFSVESHATATYLADVAVPPFSSHFSAVSRMNTNASVAQNATFPLDLGQTATASLQSDLFVNVTFSFTGQVFSSENATSFASEWKRTVLAREAVTVEAGTFSVYRLNQTVGAFPGLGTAAAPGSNETAYWSNDVRNYVKRDLYVNNSRVSELRLKSFVPGDSGSLLQSLVVIGIPWIVGAIVFLLFLLRLRRRRASATGRVPIPPTEQALPTPPPPPDEAAANGGRDDSR